MSKRHSIKVRWRAFRIWQELGEFPWKKDRKNSKSSSRDFYRGAFDSIPFLNEDAKRTFTHLLLRPGYMIRDYIRGDHERYLAPLTALIVFYAFFALIFSILQPVQQKESEFDKLGVALQSEDVREEIGDNQAGVDLLKSTAMILQKGYTYLNLDQHPEAVHTQAESSLAALEGTLRSQGIPLFIGRFFLLWFALGLALRRYRMGMPAIAAASAYILCQFSFFMLFAVILTFGQSKSVGLLVMAVVMLIDLRQWLGEPWKKSLRLTIRTGIWYAVLFTAVLLLVSGLVVLMAWVRGV